MSLVNAMRHRNFLTAVLVAASLMSGCAVTPKVPPADSRQLSRLPLVVPDARVLAAWRLPDDLYLSQYGAERVADLLVFGLHYDAAGDRPPDDARGSFGVLDMRTGRLRLLPALLTGSWTGLITGFDGYLIRTETRPSREACPYGPGRCTEWLIAATPASGGATTVIDRGVTSTESVYLPRVEVGPLGAAWQRQLAGGGTEVVLWRPGFDRPHVIGRATAQGQLAGTPTGWLLAAMWGRGPTVLDVTRSATVAAPALEGLVSGAAGLAFAVPGPGDLAGATGAVDVYVGSDVGGRLVGHRVVRVSDLYGFAWAGRQHLLVATPQGASLVPVSGGSIVPLPAVTGITVQAADSGAVIAVPAERGGVGLAVVEAG